RSVLCSSDLVFAKPFAHVVDGVVSRASSDVDDVRERLGKNPLEPGMHLALVRAEQRLRIVQGPEQHPAKRAAECPPVRGAPQRSAEYRPPRPLDRPHPVAQRERQQRIHPRDRPRQRTQRSISAVRRPPSAVFESHWPVNDPFTFMISSGVRIATTLPPPSPPSGRM